MAANLARLLVVLAAAMLGAWIGPAPLRDVIGDTIAVFAILAAFLIQVMLLLVTAFSPGTLSAERVKQITDALAVQQRQASYVFVGYLTVIVSGVVLKALTPSAANAPPLDGALSWLAHGMSGVVLGSAAFGLLGTVRFVRALRTIQTLRQKLLVDEAAARDAASLREAADNVSFLGAPPPASYGKRFGS